MDTVKVIARDFSIKAKKLRKEGFIPGSVFGGPLEDSVSLQIEEAAVKKMLSECRIGSRLTIELEGKEIPVQLKDVERDIVKNAVLSVSFQALKAGQKVNSVVSIILLNAEKFTSATVEKMTTEIPYRAMPRHMIDTIELDIGEKPVGTVFTVGDIEELKGENYELQIAEDEIVYRITDNKMAPENNEETAAE